jgi:hypothetical protein
MIVKARLISNELDGSKIVDHEVGSIFLIDLDEKDACWWQCPNENKSRVVMVVKEIDNEELIPMECLELIV